MRTDLSNPVERSKALEHEKHVERIRREARRAVHAEERGTEAPPEILTLRERLARPQSPLVWRIANLQGIGHRVLLAAQFKAGKTTFVMNVARSVLDGVDFLNTYEVTAVGGAVVLLDFEMSERQLDDWYRAVDIENDDRLLVIPMRGAASSFDITDPDIRAKWAALLKAHRAEYLILDCLRPILDALGLNEHTEAGLFLTALDALLRDADISEALVVQHMGHKGERARGDSRLLDWPDVGWTLVRESEDDPASPRFIRAFGRDVEVAETQLVYDPTTRRLAIEGGSREDSKLFNALADICRFIQTSEQPPSARQIEAAVVLQDHRQKSIRLAIKKGVSIGVLSELPGRNGGHAYQMASALIGDNALATRLRAIADGTAVDLPF